MAAEHYPQVTTTTDRECVHCGHEWQENLTNEELRKVIHNEPIGICPNPLCQLPT